MRAFKQDVVVGRVGGLHMASEDRGLYRLRTATDAPYAGSFGYGRRESFLDKLAGAIAVVIRMAIAVAILMVWVLGMYLYRDTPVALAGDGFTLAHLLVPVGFFCVFLTNRRYGPAYAFAQVVLTTAAVVALALFGGSAFRDVLLQDTIPPIREAAALGVAFFAASFLSAVVFDGARGPRWWTAPFFGSLTAAAVFPFAFYAVVYAGTETVWMDHALQYLIVLAVEAILMLIPFYLLRGIVPPKSGFGGY